jgi:4-hydroxy-tetrahydrodipicolinate synthase
VVEEQAARLEGVIAAALTPLDAELRPNAEALVRHCRNLLRHCHAVLCLGTTGEASSMSVKERLTLLEALGESGLGPRLLVGVGCCAAPDTVRLTRHALAIDAAGVLALPPFYYKKVTDEGLYAAFARVIDEVSDSRLRLYLYHIPQLSGVPIRPGLLERLLSAYSDTVVGLKDSAGDQEHTESLLRSFPKLSVFTGTERHMLAALRLGGPGCISATFNVTARYAARLYATWQDETAPERHERLSRLRGLFEGRPGGMIPALKAAMARLESAHAEEWRALRPPLLPLSTGEADELMAGLAAEGVS